jgi:UDP-2-acetamido-3-amino-2,3-dideoxy-glucuronate N-acetyltransferase
MASPSKSAAPAGKSSSRDGTRVIAKDRMPETKMAERKNVYVHPSSFVDEPCEIGEGTKIWHFCHVMQDSKIGRNCSLGQNVLVARGVQIGDNVKIQNNVSVYEGVTLEDQVFCGPSMVFTNVVNPRSEIVRKSEYRATRVEHGATLGANCTIMCGHTIGRYAFIGAGAVVTKDVPAFALMLGTPARRAGWMCHCGVRLPAGSEPKCAACGAPYREADGRLEPLGE